MEGGMARSYLDDATRHLERVRYYFEHAGAGGYSQASYHYQKLGECYRKGSAKNPGEAPVLRDMYAEAGRQMAAMRAREETAPGTSAGSY
jgi:hypothetical protein